MGHSVGHDTPELYKKLKELDLWIGQIVDAIDEAGILDKSVIVVTSDHGGVNKGHGGITMAEMRTPLIIWGKGVKKGWCFDDVPTVQQDVASVLADLLGMKLPDYCRGRSIGGIFE